MFNNIAAFVHKRSKSIIITSVLFLVVSIVLGSLSFSKLGSEGFDDPNSQSTQAKNLISQNFGSGTNVVFLVHAKHGSVDASAVSAAGTALTNKLATDTTISKLGSYWQQHSPGLRSKDGSYALIVARIVPTKEGKTTSRAKAIIKNYTTDTGTYSVQIGGSKRADIEIGNQVGASLGKAESIAIPLTLLFLLFAFGTIVSAALPLIIALLAIFGTFALLFIISSFTNVSIYAINLTTALGLGLAIDYALFIVSRFREELRKGLTVEEAVTRTIHTAGRTVVFSALAVGAALAAMTIFPLYFLRSFAYAGIGVVVISALAALFVLPAILTELGQRVEKGRLPWADRVRKVEAPFWSRLARFTMRHPALTALPVIVVLLVIASPIRNITFGTPDDRVLTTATNSHQIGDVLRSQFSSTSDNQLSAVVTGNVQNSTALEQYAETLSLQPHINSVTANSGVYSHGKRVSTQPQVAQKSAIALLYLQTSADTQSSAGTNLVTAIRAIPAPVGMQVKIGGNAASLLDARHAIASKLVISIIWIAATTFIILFLFTGSVVQPLRSLLSNGLTLAATFGLVVWIFQYGHLSGFLNFTALPINITMPVLLFCISFGLSMDYEVFLISRIKEQYEAGVPNSDAIAHGMARAGRIVSTLAIILAVSFFAFGASTISFLQLFGIGTAFAILIDATLVRGVLVPVTMHLLGDKAWYAPQFMKRIYKHAQLVDK